MESKFSLDLIETIMMASIFAQEKSRLIILSIVFPENTMETTCIIVVELAIVIVRVIIFSLQSIKGSIKGFNSDKQGNGSHSSGDSEVR